MLDAMAQGFHALMSIDRMTFLVFGVFVGMALGAIPGLGGVVGVAILLPFTFEMDRTSAIAMLVALTSVPTTTDTIPSVLFAVPGTVGSQATILDGHPMARKGEAGRAFGAAYLASMLGGIIGAVCLGLLIPILKPVVLYFAAPELFALGIMGISMVAILSGNVPLKGIIAGGLGLLLSMIGTDRQEGLLRWTFGTIYLIDGVNIIVVSLGLFAIPELADMVIEGSKISSVPKAAMKGVGQGMRDVFVHWGLMLRCSFLGTWIGIIPGLGSAVVDWLAYGHARQTCKDAALTFGKGDVRGVIAPESANNAKQGGALVPTLAFGVPGSASMALLIGAFLIHGIQPGPEMLSKHLDVTYAIVWSTAIANILATGIALLFTNQLAKLSAVRIQILAPLVMVVVFLAAFQASASMGDLITLLIIGGLGWIMKRCGWPRPPLLLGFLLGTLIERYAVISIKAYGFGWMGRPLVIAIILITILTLVYSIWQERKARKYST
ncbi:MAG TPA: tripartite tricarboxylate transporter permease, partial [Terriglobales bacterium]|nr:tripartite tricarboxylate transporter permease [Terriglobales bacterium]